MKKYMSIALLIAAGIASSQTAATSSKPVLAKVIVESAVARAAKEKKSVMVIFHASWCGWCKRLDTWMATPSVKPFFDKEFVVVHLTVMESPDKVNLENPGGVDYMKAWHGEKAGLPFTAILDDKGSLVVNSNSKNQGKEGNIGCPWAPEEQDWFFGMVAKARPHVEKGALKGLQANLQAHVKEVEGKAKGGGGR
jgi:thiol-disulfide isomerase/thioredoxin